MSDKNTILKIAKFMGWEKHPKYENCLINTNPDREIPPYCTYNVIVPIDEFKYESSMDWLYIVINKISKLTIDNFPINVTLHGDGGIYIAYNHSNIRGDIKEGDLEIVNGLNMQYTQYFDKNISNIKSYCLGVEAFIDWYNKKLSS